MLKKQPRSGMGRELACESPPLQSVSSSPYRGLHKMASDPPLALRCL